ncbi:beta-glucosidase [Microbacterium laevaniformans]|uniref:beta-glucosidase family protein n=1 Tax=Microbacterium laevaniformans TaxID=36807 RepID=UPI00362D956F
MTDVHPVIHRLSLREKASLVSGSDFWNTTALPDENVPSVMLSDGPHGVRRQANGADHLGIHAAEPSTAYPTASATASSWDRSLVEAIGRALGSEARALGVDVLLGPGLNIKRNPLCGRNFEYVSEDPLLSGEIGAAWVNGVQSTGVGSSLKHYVGNDQETDRMSISSEIDDRTLREIYLRPFQRVIERAAPATVMAAYNAVNGVPVAANHRLLTEILRNEWGYEGVVVSDWGAVRDTVASVRAGLDLEMPGGGPASVDALVGAVEEGRLPESALDIAASRVVRLAQRTAALTPTPVWDAEVGHRLARSAIEQSAVLLKNDSGLLPLSPYAPSSLAVIGEFARTPRFQGAGSSHLVPTRLDDALAAIRERTHREVVFEAGFTMSGERDAALEEAAIRAAESAGDVVVFLGLPPSAESEAFDRTTLALPDSQLALLERIAQVSDRVVVVLSNGGVVTVTPWRESVAAIMEMWLGGQASGSAAAALLFGDVNPSGKLAETIPLRLEDVSSFHNFPGDGQHVLYGERIYIGYRHFTTVGADVAYSFGYGLSYSDFRYSDFTVGQTETSLTASLTVTNVSDRDGSEIVQFYSCAPEGQADRPARELVGFTKVFIPAGESARVQCELDLSDFEYWSARHHSWVRTGGDYVLAAAASSEDLRAEATVTLTSTEPSVALTLDSKMGEWFADPAGAFVLESFLSEMSPGGGDFDEATLPLVLPMPLRTILGMSGVADLDDLESLLHRRLAEARTAPLRTEHMHE